MDKHPKKLSDLAPKRKAERPLQGMTLEEALRQVDEIDGGDPELKKMYRRIFQANNAKK
ncbi:MAG: hypothetical protein AAFU54_18775 [Chloroflexota bacterium]